MASIPSTSSEPELTWEIARFFPPQGQWTETEYLQLTDGHEHRVEFTDGHLEFLEMPTVLHQQILMHLLLALSDYTGRGSKGLVLPMGTRVYLRDGKYREPDVVFKMASRLTGDDKRYLRGADLVMEIVSEDRASHERDYETKVADYAEGQIGEYWIVDPQAKLIKVLALEGDKYVEHQSSGMGEHAQSKLLDGFSVSVDEVLSAGDRTT